MCTAVHASILGYEWVALSRVERVNVTVCVVEGAVPQVLGQLEGHLPLCQRHCLSVPYVHLAAEVKHQNLHRNTDRGRLNFPCCCLSQCLKQVETDRDVQPPWGRAENSGASWPRNRHLGPVCHLPDGKCSLSPQWHPRTARLHPAFLQLQEEKPKGVSLHCAASGAVSFEVGFVSDMNSLH